MPQRDIDAIIRASNYVRHGTTSYGGSFITCTCPKQPCGGVSADEERDDCPEHSRNPAQLWHWAAECHATALVSLQTREAHRGTVPRPHSGLPAEDAAPS